MGRAKADLKGAGVICLNPQCRRAATIGGSKADGRRPGAALHQKEV